MAEKVVAKGAEAVLYRRDGRLVKHRIVKAYRIPELDDRLRKQRTQREAKLLENAQKAGIAVPRVHEVDLRDRRIVMDFIEGRLLKDVFFSADDATVAKLSGEVGSILSRLHEANIVHNDLTTSNMILSIDRISFIDFGLSITSTRIEDKAMDLVVFKKALKATHTDRFDLIWDSLVEAYKGYERSNEVLNRIAKIEKRARYT
ncbi:MAG: Kae1-associated serine/threonine protein kinase [Candidatus Altiarchaeota archaeon]|nr:Kae1-associated serine/threonine protein kinase [Candidatus Altiarchaeota archaeon]